MAVILHSDLNCFYASVEMNEHPELHGRKVAVCGSTENRHGIVLTASYPAKRVGVKTGRANWQALQVCPDLIIVEPHYELYLKYSRLVRRIYKRYTDIIEPFGMDENWLELPFTCDLSGEGYKTAQKIRLAVRNEIGLTVSVGVSFSKIYAKLGSDMKKPDAVTLLTRENYREKIWPMPVSALLYVGPRTTGKLLKMNIRTIGDLAHCDPELMQHHLGKNGLMLSGFARGEDGCAVMPEGYTVPVKSVGHGTTCVNDLDNEYEVWRVLYALAQDVGHRLRSNEISACGVQLTVRDCELRFEQWQMPLPYETQSPLEIAQAGFELFRQAYDWHLPVRALTICAIKPVPSDKPYQQSFFYDTRKRELRRLADDCIDQLNVRYGDQVVFPATLLAPLNMATDRCETVPMPAVMYR